MTIPTPSTDISAPTTPSTKIRYIRDLKNPERVMTLVTRVEGGDLSFAVSVNSPPRTVAVPQTNGTFLYNIPGDRFCRKTGSRIALARLECERSRVTMPFDASTQHPLVLALTYLLDGQNSSLVVARIAQAELQFLEASAPVLFGKEPMAIPAEASKKAE